MMRLMLTTVLQSWRGRVLAVLGLTMFAAALVLAYKAGEMRLLW